MILYQPVERTIFGSRSGAPTSAITGSDMSARPHRIVDHYAQGVLTSRHDNGSPFKPRARRLRSRLRNKGLGGLDLQLCTLDLLPVRAGGHGEFSHLDEANGHLEIRERCLGNCS